MRLVPADPDVQTIVARIKNDDIDLQPDFQRGEVWGQAKQRRLIDSILRNWHVPPIHVIENPESATQDVLDGQQRLVAIRDFVDGVFGVDGNIPPADNAIRALDGLRYSQLPVVWKRRFDQFTIRVFRIIDFEPDEPAELFFRLNQPVALTTAEQRNAFFGPVRTQVKDAVNDLSTLPIGFSNSRMALDDVVARICLCVERRSIAQRVTASNLTERYRSQQPFDLLTVRTCSDGIRLFKESSTSWLEPVKLNKATLFSWLWFSICLASRAARDAGELLGKTLSRVESNRVSKAEPPPEIQAAFQLSKDHITSLIRLYLDRSSSRVSDVSSVIARDLVLWIFFGALARDARLASVLSMPQISMLNQLLPTYAGRGSDTLDAFLEDVIGAGWGVLK
jgi:hypothetical protein